MIEERTTVERAWPWLLRALWLALPFTVGTVVTAAFDVEPKAVRTVGLLLAWLWWACGLLAVLVPHPAGLVALRVSVLPIVAATVWGIGRSVSNDTATQPHSALIIAAMVCAIVFAAAALHAETGHWCVNGPAYANERRFLLRPPALLQVALIPFVAVLVAAGFFVGPLLLAAKRFVPGLAITVFGLAAFVIGARSLYAQTKRFLVFVPAGFVVHDYESMREPVLFQTRFIEGLRAAPADTDSLDLTSSAAGAPVEVLLHEKLEITRVANSRDRVGDTGKTARFLVVPTLRGRFLRTAQRLGLPTNL